MVITYTLYRIEPDHTETVVAYLGDQCEIGCAIDEDRQKIDYNPGYRVSSDAVGKEKGNAVRDA